MANGVTVVVAVIAGLTGWYGGVRHDAQESDRQRTGLVQSQRVQAYTGYINSANDLANAIAQEADVIEKRYPYPSLHSIPIMSAKADVDTSYSSLSHAASLVGLFGSSQVQAASQKVFDRASDSRGQIAMWNFEHPEHSPDTPPCLEVLEFANKADASDPVLVAAIDDFYDAAQDDLRIRRASAPPRPSYAPRPASLCADFPH